MFPGGPPPRRFARAASSATSCRAGGVFAEAAACRSCMRISLPPCPNSTRSMSWLIRKMPRPRVRTAGPSPAFYPRAGIELCSMAQCARARRHFGDCVPRQPSCCSACSCWPPSSPPWRTSPRMPSTHEHDGANEARPPLGRAGSAAQRAHPSPDVEEAGHGHGRGDHRSRELPAGDHGRESISHFGLALIEGPPAPVVPPPAQSIAPPPDPRPRSSSGPSRPQPPARGPPAPQSLPSTA